MGLFGALAPAGPYRWSEMLWIAFWVVWLVWGAVTNRQRPVVARGRRGVGPALWTLVILLVIWQRHFPGRFLTSALWPGHPPAAALGLFVQVLGMALALWARYYLGSFWSSAAVLREGHQVVDTGPYRLVRHPIYSGILLGFLGSFLMAGSTFILLVLVAAGAGFLWKIRGEERLLTAELGGEYVDYRRRTRMLIPWLL